MTASARTKPQLVCAVADVPESGVLEVKFRGRSYAVVRDPSGGYHALRNVCPHEGAPLSAGSASRAVVGDRAGEYALSDQCVLRCPWHGWEFDVETGRSLTRPEAVMVRRIALEVRGDELVVAEGTPAR